MADPGNFIEWADINALITVNVIHSLFRFGTIHVPEPQALLSIQRPLQQARICRSYSGLVSPFSV